MENLKIKAFNDELNELNKGMTIESTPTKIIRVPRMIRCVECGMSVDMNEDRGSMTKVGYVCKKCLR